MELALEVKFYLDFHWVTQPWRRTLTNGRDVKYVFPRCLLNADQWKGRQIRISAVSAERWPMEGTSNPYFRGVCWTLTNGRDVKYVFPRCLLNADQWKGRQIRISAVSAERWPMEGTSNPYCRGVCWTLTNGRDVKSVLPRCLLNADQWKGRQIRIAAVSAERWPMEGTSNPYCRGVCWTLTNGRDVKSVLPRCRIWATRYKTGCPFRRWVCINVMNLLSLIGRHAVERNFACHPISPFLCCKHIALSVVNVLTSASYLPIVLPYGSTRYSVSASHSAVDPRLNEVVSEAGRLLTSQLSWKNRQFAEIYDLARVVGARRTAMMIWLLE